MRLGESYEELRAYALSSIKAPSQPLGLDLWLRKGFYAWAKAMQCMVLADEPFCRASTKPAGNGLADAIVLPISNILTEWGVKNGFDH